jgi:hypothetical protein
MIPMHAVATFLFSSSVCLYVPFCLQEKRKRDAGQATRGKNYVEEEKRQARNYGVFSGFD